MFFPDTIFFKKGKPAFIAKTDKDFCLSVNKQASKIAMDKVHTEFQAIHQELVKDQNGKFAEKYGIQINQKIDSKSK